MAAELAANAHLLVHTRARLSAFLSPAYLDKVEDGVRKELDDHLLRYLDDQDGVLLAFTNLRVLSKQALVCNYFPLVNIEAAADLVLLRPRPGDLLVGRVHRLTPSMLCLLVLGGINASIPRAQLPGGFKYDKQLHCWVPGADYSRALMMGDHVACRVLSGPVTDPDGEELLFSLEACLKGDGTGLCEQQTEAQAQKRAEMLAAAAAQQAQAKQDGGGKQKKAAKKQQQQQQANGTAAVGATQQQQQQQPALSKAERKAAREAKRAAKEARHAARQQRRQEKEARRAARQQQAQVQAQQQQQLPQATTGKRPRADSGDPQQQQQPQAVSKKRKQDTQVQVQQQQQPAGNQPANGHAAAGAAVTAAAVGLKQRKKDKKKGDYGAAA